MLKNLAFLNLKRKTLRNEYRIYESIKLYYLILKYTIGSVPVCTTK